MKLSYAFAAVALLAAPAFAQTEADIKVDPSTVTCNDFALMDMQNMTAVGIAMKESMKDDAAMNTKYSALSDEDMATAAADACKAHPDGKVADALKM
ncbi:HdeA/HdeB family chaperone [Cypionkella sp. TWP1-2-1b2]|uniref:HdeA/HdeB family chaperone n=1 Tax=Cypionkella sp. TWP1-2-1b2 TaxID=2804675 RepID=UPI003CEFF120